MISNTAGSTLRRRDFIRVGSLGAFGLSVFGGLRPVATLAAAPSAKACILLWLDGGPSHLETFDVKPNAPLEVRGPFQAIRSKVAGLQLSELLPATAAIADKIAVIRSMTSPLGEHGLAHHYLLTGYKPSPVLSYPSYGAVVSKLREQHGELPSNVAIPDFRAPAGAGFLGRAHEPFAVGGDPAKPDFRVRDLDFYPGVDAVRMQRRRDFVNQIDRFQQRVESQSTALEAMPGVSDSFEQAFRMVTSPRTKQAFDLAAESPDLRAEYGPRTFGQSCLLARRLVERGVPFVTVNFTGWDTHENLVLQLKEGYSGAKVGVGLVPTFDMGFATLVRDLEQRGLLQETLVIAMGEFGRTPKLNARGGRDHWPRVFSVVMAGGGVRGGTVVGSSDAVGESPRDRPHSPADLAYTIYQALGIEPSHEIQTPDGRPVQLNQGGRLIDELLG